MFQCLDLLATVSFIPVHVAICVAENFCHNIKLYKSVKEAIQGFKPKNYNIYIIALLMVITFSSGLHICAIWLRDIPKDVCYASIFKIIRSQYL